MSSLLPSLGSVRLQQHLLLCQGGGVPGDSQDQEELSILSVQAVRGGGDEDVLGADRGGAEAEVCRKRKEAQRPRDLECVTVRVH